MERRKREGEVREEEKREGKGEEEEKKMGKGGRVKEEMRSVVKSKGEHTVYDNLLNSLYTDQLTLIHRKRERLSGTSSYDPKTVRHVIFSRKHNSIEIIH